MELVTNPAETKVVEVKPETFDLIGLSLEQMAVLTILTGNSGGQIGSAGVYDKVSQPFARLKEYNHVFADKTAMQISQTDVDAMVNLYKNRPR